MSHSESLCSLLPQDDGWRLVGDVNFQSVPDLLTRSIQAFDFSQALHIDLSQVDHADSAGLALMLEWLEQAQKAKGSVRFRGIPEALQNIARLCNVEEYIGDS